MIDSMRRFATLLVVPALGVLMTLIPAAAQPRPGAPAPELTGGPWINSRPLAVADLRGRVVLVEFWTYG
jgi:hypothetical protein